VRGTPSDAQTAQSVGMAVAITKTKKSNQEEEKKKNLARGDMLIAPPLF
jgi:hypothetical protein